LLFLKLKTLATLTTPVVVSIFIFASNSTPGVSIPAEMATHDQRFLTRFFYVAQKITLHGQERIVGSQRGRAARSGVAEGV
jgi:hypothetical protein